MTIKEVWDTLNWWCGDAITGYPKDFYSCPMHLIEAPTPTVHELDSWLGKVRVHTDEHGEVYRISHSQLVHRDKEGFKYLLTTLDELDITHRGMGDFRTTTITHKMLGEKTYKLYNFRYHKGALVHYEDSDGNLWVKAMGIDNPYHETQDAQEETIEKFIKEVTQPRIPTREAIDALLEYPTHQPQKLGEIINKELKGCYVIEFREEEYTQWYQQRFKKDKGITIKDRTIDSIRLEAIHELNKEIESERLKERNYSKDHKDAVDSFNRALNTSPTIGRMDTKPSTTQLNVVEPITKRNGDINPI